jgi:thiamine-phosphate pyrophosphorylase
MKPISECRLYTFVDSAYLHGRSPADIARDLCAGGSDIIQLRAKDWNPEKIESTAREILPVLRAHNVLLVINDHLEIACRIGADICHLGQEDFFDSGFTHISMLPRWPGHEPRIGLSTHAPEQAARAMKADAAYIAIGPVFPTGTKPRAKAVTLDYVRWAAQHATVPWFAIGGITLANCKEVLDAGASRICVVSAILNSSDIAGECRKFKALLDTNDTRSEGREGR